MTHYVPANKFQDIPSKVFDSLGIAVSITYRSRQDDVYVPGGTTSPTYTEEATRAILDTPSNTLVVQGVVRATDRIALIPRKELNAVPRPDDQVVMAGRTFTVLEPVNTDPAEALWEVPIRG